MYSMPLLFYTLNWPEVDQYCDTLKIGSLNRINKWLICVLNHRLLSPSLSESNITFYVCIRPQKPKELAKLLNLKESFQKNVVTFRSLWDLTVRASSSMDEAFVFKPDTRQNCIYMHMPLFNDTEESFWIKIFASWIYQTNNNNNPMHIESILSKT